MKTETFNALVNFHAAEKHYEALKSAERILPIFERRFPDDKRPRRALELARAYLENPTEENKTACLAAVYAAAYADAKAAYDACDAYAAAHDAYAAAHDAYAAAHDAKAAAHDAYAAAHDAYAAAHDAYAAAHDAYAAAHDAYAYERSRRKALAGGKN